MATMKQYHKGDSMTKSQKEGLYWMLSVLTITLIGGSCLIFGSHPQTQDKVAKHSKSAASLLKKAVKAVNDADCLATAAAIQEAQKAVDKLAESSKKKTLQEQLNVAKAKQEQEDAATQAVKAAEETLNQNLKDIAQKAVNDLSNKGKKAALQSRLDAILPAKPIIDEFPRQSGEITDNSYWTPFPGDVSDTYDNSQSPTLDPSSESSASDVTPQPSHPDPIPPQTSSEPSNSGDKQSSKE
ncbi:lipoprotein [Streptococcus pyogenes]|uniref:hypothetical protein n=1 Tax=Streptococcus pyogenes TaxID=1314 RepID=UPI0010A1B7C1|nr:hypothetical protein [Streptococcus pyogenes]VHF26367.1 lipoprotein [Streptococcus pyogenes]VHM90685.1 lipoprotein [Streptococcus pyogenes]HER6178062.1 hypothetical protein [Streptococcus pyogenes]HER6181086.1 hypothetical protein [Streptococcus pyogenes]HER6193254.1 hypothetical protein [Streptococcus pyogenes]